MRYIINESRLNKLIDNLFANRYGDSLTKKIDSEGYIFFYDEFKKKPYELNQAGTLWVNDYPFLRQVKRLIGLKGAKAVDEVFKNYFLEKYDVNVERVNSEGGYSKLGDPERDIDPWFDNELDDETNQMNESKINNKIFLFLDSYLEDYSPEETSTLILYGKGQKNQIAYDKGDQILFVSNHLFDLIKNMFNLSKTSTKQMFKDYFQSKGLRVKRFM